MAIVTAGQVLQTALWQQGDIRDPLGVWGTRIPITGDGTGGSIKATMDVPALERSSYIYTVYSVIMVQLTGAAVGTNIKARILTNWPDIDTAIIGVQGYATWIALATRQDGDFTAPISGPSANLIAPNDRFILCFDPRPQVGLGDLALVEIEWGENIDLATYSVEGYGYFWDRSVLDAPGGPRHPGSS